MSEPQFGLEFTERLIRRVQDSVRLDERFGADAGPYLSLQGIADGSPAGQLRLWVAPATSRLDRLIHCRLLSPPVDTHLLFVFGRADTAMPHFHAQVVQFAADACVYNADIIPRLDPVEHPEYFREVYGPITRAYWTAATNQKNVCSLASANPGISVYMSPWGIAAGRPTTKAELDRVSPSIDAYMDQILALTANLAYQAPPAQQMRDRDRRHMAILHSDDLDPRAWKGVYRILGEDAGRRVKHILTQPIR